MRTVHLMLVTIDDETKHGEWCDTCALPSVSVFRYEMVRSDTYESWGFGSFKVCDHCSPEVAA